MAWADAQIAEVDAAMAAGDVPEAITDLDAAANALTPAVEAVSVGRTGRTPKARSRSAADGCGHH
ncbi:hypothetical protein [Streptomyces decoyicus]